MSVLQLLSFPICRPKHTQTRTWRRDFLEHNGDHRWLYAAAVHTLFHQRYFFSLLLGYSVLLKAHRTICGFLNILEWCPHDDVMRARIISIRDFSTTTGNMTESEAMMCKRHEWDEAREEGKVMRRVQGMRRLHISKMCVALDKMWSLKTPQDRLWSTGSRGMMADFILKSRSLAVIPFKPSPTSSIFCVKSDSLE